MQEEGSYDAHMQQPGLQSCLLPLVPPPRLTDLWPSLEVLQPHTLKDL